MRARLCTRMYFGVYLSRFSNFHVCFSKQFSFCSRWHFQTRLIHRCLHPSTVIVSIYFIFRYHLIYINLNCFALLLRIFGFIVFSVCLLFTCVDIVFHDDSIYLFFPSPLIVCITLLMNTNHYQSAFFFHSQDEEEKGKCTS